MSKDLCSRMCWIMENPTNLRVQIKSIHKHIPCHQHWIEQNYNWHIKWLSFSFVCTWELKRFQNCLDTENVTIIEVYVCPYLPCSLHSSSSCLKAAFFSRSRRCFSCFSSSARSFTYCSNTWHREKRESRSAQIPDTGERGNHVMLKYLTQGKEGIT